MKSVYTLNFSLGKLVKQATDFFNPSPAEEKTGETLPPEPKTTSTTENTSTEQSNEGQGGPFDAVVVDAIDLPPVRSNVDPDQPLR